MIQCKLCSTIKAKNYLFTECEHLVCTNCAALRVTEGIKCCGVNIQISNAVRKELCEKKELILQNLSKSYSYEKSDLDDLEKL